MSEAIDTNLVPKTPEEHAAEVWHAVFELLDCYSFKAGEVGRIAAACAVVTDNILTGRDGGR